MRSGHVTQYIEFILSSVYFTLNWGVTMVTMVTSFYMNFINTFSSDKLLWSVEQSCVFALVQTIIL